MNGKPQMIVVHFWYSMFLIRSDEMKLKSTANVQASKVLVFYNLLYKITTILDLLEDTHKQVLCPRRKSVEQNRLRN